MFGLLLVLCAVTSAVLGFPYAAPSATARTFGPYPLQPEAQPEFSGDFPFRSQIQADPRGLYSQRIYGPFPVSSSYQTQALGPFPVQPSYQPYGSFPFPPQQRNFGPFPSAVQQIQRAIPVNPYKVARPVAAEYNVYRPAVNQGLYPARQERLPAGLPPQAGRYYNRYQAPVINYRSAAPGLVSEPVVAFPTTPLPGESEEVE